MELQIIVGVDVSKATLDITWLPNGELLQFSNNEQGIQALLGSLRSFNVALVVVEATGG